MTKQQQAEELLGVLMNSSSHNPAWVLQEVLEKLRNQLTISGGGYDWDDEQGMMYNHGYDDCLKDIDYIIDELELL
jgi:hypothetical protein